MLINTVGPGVQPVYETDAQPASIVLQVWRIVDYGDGGLLLCRFAA
jgi:hypothetical protein